MAPNPTDEKIAELEREHPEWQVWVVQRVVGGPVWCARRHEDRDAVPARVLNADSAEHLAEYLNESLS